VPGEPPERYRSPSSPSYSSLASGGNRDPHVSCPLTEQYGLRVLVVEPVGLGLAVRAIPRGPEITTSRLGFQCRNAFDKRHSARQPGHSMPFRASMAKSADQPGTVTMDPARGSDAFTAHITPAPCDQRDPSAPAQRAT